MIQCFNCRGCPEMTNIPMTGSWQNWGDEYDGFVAAMSQINLLVVLESPYKTRATGIALCKPTWIEMLDDQYSALPLLCGLGIRLKNAAYNVAENPEPKNFFLRMAEKGVVFVNALMVPAENGQNRSVNPKASNWLSKAGYVVQCGTESQNLHSEDETHFHIVHPSSQCRNHLNSSVSSRWYAAYGYHGALLDVIKSKNEEAYEAIKTIVQDVNNAFG